MSDPGDETPEAMGCANDCCHPDHRHNVAVADTLYCGECFQPVPETHCVWVGKDGLRYTNRYGGVTNIEGMEIASRHFMRRLLENARDAALVEALYTTTRPLAKRDTHDQWRELNDETAE